MEAKDLLKAAWKAVAESGVPKELHEVAFREAVAYLRGEEGGPTRREGSSTPQLSKRTRKASPAKATSKGTARRATPTAKSAVADDARVAPVEDVDDFFATLARESGVEESELRQVLHVTDHGVIEVPPPTRDLGKNKAAQARTVIALVAGARHGGLGESSVSTSAVRDECTRKRCYDQNNFAYSHLAALKGFNASGPDKIIVNAKWVKEFDDAVGRAVGRKTDAEEE